MHVLRQLLSSSSLLALLCCVLLLVGCAPENTPTSMNTGSTQPAQIVSANWERIPLPGPLLAYMVASSDPNTLYICTGSAAAPGPIVLWKKSRDEGQWRRISLSGATGTGCSFASTATQSAQIAVMITNTIEKQRACDQNMLFLSSDDGASWERVPHTSIAPMGKGADFCQIAATEGHLYWWYSYSLPEHSPQVSILERSDDHRTWTRADSALGQEAFFSPPQVIDDRKNLATIVTHLSSLSGSSRSILWVSHNAGNSWQPQAALPEQVGTFLLAAPAQEPSQATPLYVLAHEQLPSHLYQTQIYQSENESEWAQLPALPVLGRSSERSGLLQVLTVTSDGRLLAFGADPQNGITKPALQQPVASFRLWIWNPHLASWQVLSSPLRYTANEGCGLCWSASIASSSSSRAYLYAHYWGDGNSLFRIHVPDAT
ncbi:hypothetical protein KSD_44230 [Ktedonobacter sp. SOSP1-85]|uniref:hypothetical protein n=1 Tax=Ktedonobacter sp. SOSP1-85 TaxID=2778367 RepID=UPI001915D2DC|nr:hypothetical protein [Ktedonobacter sp. SOSP1-85]GHO76652.1 hypothetical protein KSD_44230 [Ktedonobacter sp. SOSP1-85]